jgi:DNA-binding transcriptional LysR family regulator
MPGLDDLYLFAKVVEHGGFAVAARALGMPKSTLGRRISQLEERLGVRLVHRSTRHFKTTDIGQIYYSHCAAVSAEAEAAQEAIERIHAAPRGTIRISCPVALLHCFVAQAVARFLVAYPQVNVQLTANNRRVDIIEEGFDVALRVRYPPLEDSELVMKVLAASDQALVASPALIEKTGPLTSPHDIARMGSIDLFRDNAKHVWHLKHANGKEVAVVHEPRFATDDMIVLAQAAIDSVGVVQLPQYVVQRHLEEGALKVVMPEWTPHSGIIHAVFPSRRGLVPAVRAFIDFLAIEFAHYAPQA